MTIDDKVTKMLENAVLMSSIPEIAQSMGYKAGYLQAFINTLAIRYPEVANELDNTIAWQEKELTKS